MNLVKTQTLNIFSEYIQNVFWIKVITHSNQIINPYKNNLNDIYVWWLINVIDINYKSKNHYSNDVNKSKYSRIRGL